MPKPPNRKSEDEVFFDVRDLKTYMKVPARLKFKFLEEASAFFERIKPRRSRKIWEKLKAEGW